MDFSYSPEQVDLRSSVIAFAQRELDDDVIARDRGGVFATEGWKRCAAFGIQGLPVPAEYGGRGADPVTIAVAMEALGYACADNGLLFCLGAQMWSAEMPILRFGTEEQRRRYLPGMCDGSIVGVQGMTEPGSGSDAFSLTTRAEPADDGWVLNGVKTYVTSAPVADVFVIFASTDPARGFAGVSTFLVDRATPGLSVGEPFQKMGLRTSPMTALTFTDCPVPPGSLLGPVGGGLAIFNHSMDWERSLILASALGTMERQLERCVKRARERTQFGQPIGKFQAVSHTIVDMKLRLTTARFLVHHVAWLRSQGKPTTVEAAMAKLWVSEAFLQSSLDAVQVHGAEGYMSESELERDVRDAVAARIYSGTSAVMRNIVAARLGL